MRSSYVIRNYYKRIQQVLINGYNFILCKKCIGTPFIKLVCDQSNLQDAEKLLKLVEEKSITDGFNYIAIHDIICNDLITWYMMHGFIIENEIRIDNDSDNTIVYLMSKKLR